MREAVLFYLGFVFVVLVFSLIFGGTERYEQMAYAEQENEFIRVDY